MIYDPKEFLAAQPSLTADARIDALVSVLRGPKGCPWDQRQTAQSIIDFVIDEAYELKEALHFGEKEDVAAELGDLLFTMAFLRQTLADTAKAETASTLVVEKMIGRHPHVFENSDETVVEEDEIKRRWEAFKNKEFGKRRLDGGLPVSLSPWRKSAKVLARARNAGFRYSDESKAWDKAAEEWSELQEAIRDGDLRTRQAELGDLLLALQTASLEAGLDGEVALLGAARKLSDRIEALENQAQKPLSEIPYGELKERYGLAREEVTSAYFVFCGICRWPTEALAAVNRASQMLASEGNPASMRMLDEREELRKKIGTLVDANPQQVVFVPNVSAAATGVGYCLDWREGESVLIGAQEFPANTVPWRLAASTLGVRVHEFDDDLLRSEPEKGWSELKAKLKELRPRLLAISAVSYWSGFRAPLKRLAELCHSVGTLLFVDGVQAAGVTPLSLLDGIDFLACGSHKSLLGPEGAGFLVVSESASSHWVPRLGSWLSLPDPVDFLISGRHELNPNKKTLPLAHPQVLEGSSIASLGYAGLSGSLDFILGQGVDRIYAHVQGLHDLLEPGLCKLGFFSLRAKDISGRSSVLSFDPPPDVDLVRLKAVLAEARVEVTIPRGRLRFGLHFANSRQEVDYALAEMAKALPTSTICK